MSVKAEPLLSDFCREYILPHVAIVRAGIGTEEVVGWLFSLPIAAFAYLALCLRATGAASTLKKVCAIGKNHS